MDKTNTSSNHIQYQRGCFNITIYIILLNYLHGCIRKASLLLCNMAWPHYQNNTSFSYPNPVLYQICSADATYKLTVQAMSLFQRPILAAFQFKYNLTITVYHQFYTNGLVPNNRFPISGIRSIMRKTLFPINCRARGLKEPREYTRLTIVPSNVFPLVYHTC